MSSSGPLSPVITAKILNTGTDMCEQAGRPNQTALYEYTLFAIPFASFKDITAVKQKFTLKCLSIGTPNTTIFPFVPNGKRWLLGVPIFEDIIIRL